MDLDVARELFTRAGLPVAEPDRSQIDPLLMLRLRVSNDRDTSQIVLSAALYPVSAYDTPHLDASSTTGDTVGEAVRLSIGLHDFQVRALAGALNIPENAWSDFIDLAHKLYTFHIQHDALHTSCERLALTTSNKWVVLEPRVTIDSNAYARQPAVQAVSGAPTHPEGIAAVIELPGDIACVVNGAGLAMLTIDALARSGNHASAIVDMGSSALMDKLIPALDFAQKLPHTRVVLLNCFSGFTRCVDIANAVIQWKREHLEGLPLVVRFAGYDGDEGRSLIHKAGVIGLYDAREIEEAARRAVYTARMAAHPASSSDSKDSYGDLH
ncbi:MAG: hypothetical protein U0670_24980 [Anaerolineae bacterium]